MLSQRLDRILGLAKKSDESSHQSSDEAYYLDVRDEEGNKIKFTVDEYQNAVSEYTAEVSNLFKSDVSKKIITGKRKRLAEAQEKEEEIDVKRSKVNQ